MQTRVADSGVHPLASFLLGLRTVQLVQNFRHPSIDLLRDEIGTVINEDAAFAKNKASFRTQLCFAVKPGINGLLDVARKTYLETSEGAQTLV